MRRYYDDKNIVHTDKVLVELALRIFAMLSIIAVLLSGCIATSMTTDSSLLLPATVTHPYSPIATQTSVPPTTHVTSKPPSSTPSATVTPTPTPTPPQILDVCTTNTFILSPFTSSTTTDDILAFIYTYATEKVSYRWEPHLITNIPTGANGGVMTRTISVNQGDFYVDYSGVTQKHNNAESITHNQMIVTFTLKSDLKWSDGHAMTSKDFVFGYELAKDMQAYGRWHDLSQLTSQFIALDEYRIRWEGLPGYISTDYPGFIFPPQPSHSWQGLTFIEMIQDAKPPTNGPYRIVAWEDESTLLLEANPYYVGNPPHIKNVRVKFLQKALDLQPEFLADDTCDIYLPNSHGDDNSKIWQEYADKGNGRIWSTPSSTLLRLDFNANAQGKQEALIGSTRTRLALAHCVSRDHLAQLPLGHTLIPAMSFVPPIHPAYEPAAVWRVPHNTEIGQGILEELGWIDEDADGIREAHGVETIAESTPLTLTLITSTQNQQVAEILSHNFSKCGVGIALEAYEPQQFYAASSVSPLFSQNFDLALYSWHTEIPDGCRAWSSSHLPDPKLNYDLTNFGGFSNEMFEQTCQSAILSLDVDNQYSELHRAQSILSEEQATLFLAWLPRWLISDVNVTGVILDITTYGRIWHPELIEFVD